MVFTVNQCIACQALLSQGKMNEYHQCPHCRSYVYLSDRSAADVNKAFFNRHFQDLQKLKISKPKRAIYDNFLNQDRKARKKAYSYFKLAQLYLERLLHSGGKVLEVGFGEGHHLYCLLQQGVDAYGVDISEVAVRNFASRHPQYQKRVICGKRVTQSVDLIYCCALFEHLDHPEEFLKDAYQELTVGGKLILDGIPVLNPKGSKLCPTEDINFWKPYHRIIYSLNGLRGRLKKSGFILTRMGLIDDYNYRVLSLHQKMGFGKVSELRNSCFDHPGLADKYQFQAICQKALTINSLALFCNAVFEKV
jgi:SAM-dependent methyltransferase/DNA-directed RNA polymerase subunit RPC12/RpoP